jgi:alpha-beta hydrolase superfamily lysophospholipase
MGSSIGEVAARDGTRLRTRCWPARGTPWALAVLVHGLGEHSGRYEPVAAPLAEAGVEVRSFDLRGFGASGGRRAYVDRWEELGDDVADRVEDARVEQPDLPLVLYGHSLGGLIVLDAVVRGVVRPDLVVLSAPAVADTIAPWRRAGARVLARLVPTLALPNALPAGGLSTDAAVARDAAADTLNQSSSTVRLGAEAFAAQVRLGRRLAALRHLPTPTYVLHGSADPIVPVEATAALDGFPEVTRVVHPGLRHECHHEPTADAVMASVVEWLRQATEALRSGQSNTASGERARAESVAQPQTRGT